MPKYKEPCGCISDDTQWLTLCPEHFKLRENRLREMPLDSLEWLMRHHDRFPNEDNLRHVIIRLKQVGRDAYSRGDIVNWLRTNADVVKRTIHKLAQPVA